MARSHRAIKNPFIVRVNVLPPPSDEDEGERRYTKVSIPPTLYTALQVVGEKQPIPLTAAFIVKSVAERTFCHDKASYSRAVQEALILKLVELLAGNKELSDEIAKRVASYRSKKKGNEDGSAVA